MTAGATSQSTPKNPQQLRRLRSGGPGSQVTVAVLALALLATAVLILSAQRQSRERLDNSLTRSARASAEFTQVAVEELGRRQAIAAESRLVDTATTEDLGVIASTLGVGFALVLDSDGTLLAVHPDREIDGPATVAAFPHLQRALTGKTSVSATLAAPSFPSGVAIAVAAPFEGRDGLRVLSTAFDRDATVLSGNLRGVRVTPNTTAWLVDETGGVVAFGASAEPPPELPIDVLDGVVFDLDDQAVVAIAVDGTPWTVIASAPATELYALLRGWTQWQPWIALAMGIVASSLLVLLSRRQRMLSFELTVANEELATTASRMRDFVAIASHELRTPASVILGYALLLDRRGTDLSETERSRATTRLVRSSQRLARLTDELTTQATADRGELDLQIETIDVAAVAADAVENAVLANSEPVTVQTTVPVLAQADAVHLHRVLDNLLENAQVYGAQPIQVRVDDVDGWAEIRVRDHGDGVDPEFVPELFERFSRGRHAMASNGPDGTGLGLSLSRGIAEQMGGTLTHEHASPGSSFVLRLPKAPPTSPLD